MLNHGSSSQLADPPIKDIHTFIGNITIGTSATDLGQKTVVPLSADNVLWANTVLAAGSAVGMVVYTGRETRASMNTSEPESKVGLLDIEINKMAKVGLVPIYDIRKANKRSYVPFK